MATPMLTVNAAFLQEIKEDNEQLRALLAEVLGICGAPPSGRMRFRRLNSLLAELRDQLAMHFSLEEAYGYFEEPLSVAPHLSERAESLRMQHRELYREICHLAERAETLSSRNGHIHGVPRLARSVRDFCNCLQNHEAKENDLIVQAYNVDFGVGD